MRVHFDAIEAAVEHGERTLDNLIHVRGSNLRGREARQGGELVDQGSHRLYGPGDRVGTTADYR